VARVIGPAVAAVLVSTVLAAAPTLPAAVAACAITGAASVVFLTTGNSTIQLASDPAYRGRVTALWSLALVGSTPIGSPIIGAVSQLTSPRWALALGATARAVVAAIGRWPVSTRSQTGPAGTEPSSALLRQPEPLVHPGQSQASCAS
jgi:hypothetical protein